MKTFKLKLSIVLTMAIVLLLTSCVSDKLQDEIVSVNPADFNFKTTKEFEVSVTTLNNGNSPMSGVYVELYTKNPLKNDGSLIADSEDYLIFKGITNANGSVITKIAPPSYVDSLSVIVNHVGLPNYKAVKLSSAKIDVVVGGSSSQNSKSNVALSKVKQVGIWFSALLGTQSDFKFYSNWSTAGIPNMLEKVNDEISNEFLADINASLPERIKLPVSHPEYISSEDDGSIVLVEDAEVWITFVHEGAGYLNTLGYYTYPTANPPVTTKDITNSTLIFPNASFSGSGGGLKSGNKVQLLYFNGEKYTNLFPAGTTVAWIFRSNGWNGKGIGTGYNTFYSDKRFNPEPDALKKHNVVLKDDVRKLFLIGFEDIRRDQASDDDFNDGVFYATASPYTAVKSGIYKSIATPKDSDKDGVLDGSDEYPNDPTRAFNNYYPGNGKVGTLAFEDLWPYKGDYDFNDLVVDYNFNQITNAKNEIAAIEAEFTVRAIGASFKNGFGIELNTSADNILSVTGQKLTENIINLAPNGTEYKQEKAVIIAFDNAFSVTPHPGNGLSVNTVTGEKYQTPGTVKLKIEFKTPVSFKELGTAPFNPFIFVNGDRSKEIHLPASKPTSLANMSLLGSGNDNSDASKGKYYQSDKYLPWAINIPTKFDYPAEKEDITLSFYNFNKWTASSGFNYMDWYLNLNGYRDTKKIFVK